MKRATNDTLSTLVIYDIILETGLSSKGIPFQKPAKRFGATELVEDVESGEYQRAILWCCQDMGLMNGDFLKAAKIVLDCVERVYGKYMFDWMKYDLCFCGTDHIHHCDFAQVVEAVHTLSECTNGKPDLLSSHMAAESPVQICESMLNTLLRDISMVRDKECLQPGDSILMICSEHARQEMIELNAKCSANVRKVVHLLIYKDALDDADAQAFACAVKAALIATLPENVPDCS
jgi:hypothetical protein